MSDATAATPTPAAAPKGEVKDRLRIDRGEDSITVHHYRGLGWTDEGKTVIRSVAFSLSDVPDVLDTAEGKISLKGYGLSKLLMERNSDTSGDPAAKLTEMEETYSVLKTGKWREYAETGPRAPRQIKVDPALAQAVAEAKGVSFVAAMSALAKKTKEELAAFAEIPALKDRIASIRKEAEGVNLTF